MYQSYLIYFLPIQLFYYVSFFFFFFVKFNNDLLIPVPNVNTKFKEAPVIPAGVPTTEAYESIYLTYQMMLIK